MTRPLLITLFTFGIIFAVYIVLIVIIGLVVNSVQKHIDRKEHAINVLMAQKYDLLVALGSLMKENGVELPKNIAESLNLDDATVLKNINTAERMNLRNVMYSTVSTMFFIAEDHGMEESQRYRTLKHSLREIDDQHRKDVAIYNAQVMAYNYWIHFFFFRPVAFVCRLRKKETMY